MRIVDWLARTAMLVLAAMATLALIGSLASVSDSPVAGSFPGPVADVDGPPPPGIEPSATPPSAPPEATPVEQRQAATIQRLRTAAESSREIARWLTALTYAVIALVAVAAAGVIALVRIGGHVARVAER